MGSEWNKAETVKDVPTIGTGPKIKISQRIRFKLLRLDDNLKVFAASRFNLAELPAVHKEFRL